MKTNFNNQPILREYLETLLFTTSEDEFPEYCYSGEFSASNEDISRFDSQAINRSKVELDVFERQARGIVGWGVLKDSWPRDFAYSRNGHGTGFFDRDELYTKEQRDKLQDLAASFGEVYVVKHKGPKSLKCKIAID